MSILDKNYLKKLPKFPFSINSAGGASTLSWLFSELSVLCGLEPSLEMGPLDLNPGFGLDVCIGGPNPKAGVDVATGGPDVGVSRNYFFSA